MQKFLIRKTETNDLKFYKTIYHVLDLVDLEEL